MGARVAAGTLILVVGVVAVSCGSDGNGADSSGDASAASGVLCPILWTWVTDVGEIFNVASRDVAGIDTGEARRQRWLDALDQIEARNQRLVVDLADHREEPILDRLIAQIERDLPRADTELDDIRALFADQPEIDEARHQDRTAQLIVRIEKVIDLPKPELAALVDADRVIPAFRAVPSCQHAVNDVDDGIPRANG